MRRYAVALLLWKSPELAPFDAALSFGRYTGRYQRRELQPPMAPFALTNRNQPDPGAYWVHLISPSLRPLATPCVREYPDAVSPFVRRHRSAKPRAVRGPGEGSNGRIRVLRSGDTAPKGGPCHSERREESRPSPQPSPFFIIMRLIRKGNIPESEFFAPLE